MTVFIISVAIMVFGLIFRVPLLQVVFGAIEPEVMENAMIYFLITVVSYPFLALFNAGAAFFRAESNAKLPMFVAAGTNVLNIAGNAVFRHEYGCCRCGIIDTAVESVVHGYHFCTVKT